MTDVSDVSDTSPEEHPSPVTPVQVVSARELSRNTAAILREVADGGHSFAIRHFGRVVGFLVPRHGRTPVHRAGKVSYEVPVQEPLRDLDADEKTILQILGRLGRAILDELMADIGFSAAAMALAKLEGEEPRLVERSSWGWQLTDEGRRHLEALEAVEPGQG